MSRAKVSVNRNLTVLNKHAIIQLCFLAFGEALVRPKIIRTRNVVVLRETMNSMNIATFGIRVYTTGTITTAKDPLRTHENHEGHHSHHSSCISKHPSLHPKPSILEWLTHSTQRR